MELLQLWRERGWLRRNAAGFWVEQHSAGIGRSAPEGSCRHPATPRSVERRSPRLLMVASVEGETSQCRPLPQYRGGASARHWNSWRQNCITFTTWSPRCPGCLRCPRKPLRHHRGTIPANPLSLCEPDDSYLSLRPVGPWRATPAPRASHAPRLRGTKTGGLFSAEMSGDAIGDDGGMGPIYAKTGSSTAAVMSRSVRLAENRPFRKESYLCTIVGISTTHFSS